MEYSVDDYLVICFFSVLWSIIFFGHLVFIYSVIQFRSNDPVFWVLMFPHKCNIDNFLNLEKFWFSAYTSKFDSYQSLLKRTRPFNTSSFIVRQSSLIQSPIYTIQIFCHFSEYNFRTQWEGDSEQQPQISTATTPTAPWRMTRRAPNFYSLDLIYSHGRSQTGRRRPRTPSLRGRAHPKVPGLSGAGPSG